MNSNFQDYDVAATYFRQLISFYTDKEWQTLSTVMLDMWADCLKSLGNARESIVVALRALTKGKLQDVSFSSFSRSLSSILELSNSLKEPIIVPFDHHFRYNQLHRQIHHFPQKDGFGTMLEFESLFESSFEASRLDVQIHGFGEENDYDIQLSLSADLCIKPGKNSVRLSSKVEANQQRLDSSS